MRKTGILIFAIALFVFSCKSSIGTFKKNPTSPKDYAFNFLNKENIPGMSISVSKK